MGKKLLFSYLVAGVLGVGGAIGQVRHDQPSSSVCVIEPRSNGVFRGGHLRYHPDLGLTFSFDVSYSHGRQRSFDVVGTNEEIFALAKSLQSRELASIRQPKYPYSSSLSRRVITSGYVRKH